MSLTIYHSTMKRILSMLLLTWLAISANAITVTDTLFHRYEHEDYAFGADVSFVPMMESWGTKWLDKNGRQKDILQILKEQGINNIRLRVWTVSSGASSKQEVVDMCRRASAKGMGVMIDFHYSDTWADPGNQTIPSAWTDHSVEALAQKVYDHTYDVLSAIKAAGVIPKWVQVGNETKRGMLYPVGQTNKGGSVAFARFVQSGYDAVKAVDPSMQVIVHLPDGHDNSLYRSIFDGLKNNGAKWDIIGMSAYPRWSHLDGPTMITKVMANINDLKNRYKTPCMVVETGHYPREAIAGNQYMVGLMDRMIKNGDLGCFYWEPESMGGYDMGAWDESTRMPTVMMDAFLGVKHSEVAWLMKTQMTAPKNEETVTSDLQLKAYVKHIRNRIASVDFYLDKTKQGTLSKSPYAWSVEPLELGVHTAWIRATDTDGFTQMSDTVSFFYGKSALMDEPILANATERGGTARWGIMLNAPGKYRMLVKYSANGYCGTEVRLDGDSLCRIYFTKKTDAYMKRDIEVSPTGTMELSLMATGAMGLPDIAWLRIFPLEGQPLPVPANLTAVAVPSADDGDSVEVYTLTGIRIGCLPLSALDISLGNRSAAVVTLPHIVSIPGSPVVLHAGRPYVVRRLSGSVSE